MSAQIGKDNATAIQNSWNALSQNQRAQTTKEAHAKSWLERNFDNLSDNAISMAVSAAIGAMLGTS